MGIAQDTVLRADDRQGELMGCNGDCCEGFTVADWTVLQVEYWKEHGQEYDEPIDAATQAIIDMLIPTNQDAPDAELGVFGCNNFDTATRRCIIYETRPGMCRTYPDGKECQHEGCTFAPTTGK